MDGNRNTPVSGTTGGLWDRRTSEAATSAPCGRIPTQPYPDAHFATFPEALIIPCILAGTSERGGCATCGAPWEREVETKHYGSWGQKTEFVADQPNGLRGENFYRAYEPPRTTGRHPTCDHQAAAIPCTVLDPFAGSGTTLLVAQRLGRHGIGIDLSEPYCRLAQARLEPVHSQLQLFPR